MKKKIFYVSLLILIVYSFYLYYSADEPSSITGANVLETTPNLEGPFLVIKVVDGDTITLNDSNKVRFSGINTPEKKQCYYQEAKDELTRLLLDKEVYLERDRTDKDKYGRLLRYVYLDEMLVNAYMVEKGYAKVYDKYKDDTKRYSELKQDELVAINNNLGVWTCS